MLNLNGVMLSSQQPQALVEFYNKILGKSVWDEDGFVSWQVGKGFLTVGPHDQVKGPAQDPARIIVFMETTDVKGEFERIKALGAKVVAEPYQPAPAQDMWLATMADPDGNYFQLASPWEDAK